ncbi:MAG: hypothetical protein QOI02_1326 [Actinomycetota bacterium]|jgi:hypothetical protein|nr:hypothetical protein [Actinomycetota bacterium]
MLIGTEAADVLVEYSAKLGPNRSDAVKLNVISTEGVGVAATLLLGGSIPLVVETARSELPEPDNSAAVARMRRKGALITSPPSVLADDSPEAYYGGNDDIGDVDRGR